MSQVNDRSLSLASCICQMLEYVACTNTMKSLDKRKHYQLTKSYAILEKQH